MARRYYICKVLDSVSPDGRYVRLKLGDLGVDHSAVIGFDAAGDPRPYGIAIVSAPDHTALLADADMDALPDVSLDVAWTAVPLAVRNTIRTRLQARGFSVAEIVAGRTYRQILRFLMRQLDSTADENAFDVSG